MASCLYSRAAGWRDHCIVGYTPDSLMQLAAKGCETFYISGSLHFVFGPWHGCKVVDKRTVEDVEESIRRAIARVGVSDPGPEFDEAVRQLVEALEFRDSGLPPSGSG